MDIPETDLFIGLIFILILINALFILTEVAIADSHKNQLEKMLDEGNLTPELELQRKQDSVRSAQNMLKDLDLKTEQGRYIQGLLYQYWEKQAKKYKNGQSSMNQKDHPNNKVKGMGDLITANNQLEYWKSQNSYTETDETSNTEADGEASSEVQTAY